MLASMLCLSQARDRWKCKRCGKSFNRKDNFTRHMTTVHDKVCNSTISFVRFWKIFHGRDILDVSLKRILNVKQTDRLVNTLQNQNIRVACLIEIPSMIPSSQRIAPEFYILDGIMFMGWVRIGEDPLESWRYLNVKSRGRSLRDMWKSVGKWG